MVNWSQFATWDHVEILRSMLETVTMAFLGTSLASIVTLPLGFLGARNVIPNTLFRFLTRRVFDVFRGLDQLIWALVFVRAMGLGVNRRHPGNPFWVWLVPVASGSVCRNVFRSTHGTRWHISSC